MIVPNAHHDIPSFGFRNGRKPPWGAISLDLWTWQLSGLFDLLLVRLCLDASLDAVRQVGVTGAGDGDAEVVALHLQLRSIASQAGASEAHVSSGYLQNEHGYVAAHISHTALALPPSSATTSQPHETGFLLSRKALHGGRKLLTQSNWR